MNLVIDESYYSQFGNLFEAVLNKFGDESVIELQQNLNKNRSSASGALSSSINFQIIQGSNKFTFELSMLDYYKWVDKGRRPGKQPPPNEIISWLKYPSVIAKLGQNYPVASHLTASKAVNKGGHKKLSVSKESKLKSLAFLIGRKIGKKGTKATNFYSDVINDEAINELRTALKSALKRDVLITLSKEN